MAWKSTPSSSSGSTRGSLSARIGRLDALRDRLTAIVGRPVDIIAEPVRKDQLRRAIETESALAF